MDMSGNKNSTAAAHSGHAMMHMTFFWGKNAEILFSGWPGSDNNLGMYVFSLIVIFALAAFAEWLSDYSSSDRYEDVSGGHVAAGLLQTAAYGLRIGLLYLLMLAVMSFNGGVFLAAVSGHGVGFFVFGSLAFKKSPLTSYVKRSDLTPTEL